LQNPADGLKLFLKEVIYPIKADKVLYFLGPVIFIGSSIAILAAIPITDGFYLADVDGGILLIMATFAIAPLSILISGWASNNKYSLIGGMRSAAQMMSYEIPLLISMMGVVIIAGTLSPIGIVQNFDSYDIAHKLLYFACNIIGMLVFMICMIAEVERIPFDLPEAEAELVEGWTTEFGGMRFGMFMLTEYIRVYCAAALMAILFLGGWLGPFHETPILSNIPAPVYLILGLIAIGIGAYFKKISGVLFGIFLIIATVIIFFMTAPFLNVVLADYIPRLDFINLGVVYFVIKVFIIFFIFIWVRAALVRVRVDQILNLGWKRLLPLAMINLIIAIIVSLGGWL
jgi:NADH-quinone oxidoreductase subunit H